MQKIIGAFRTVKNKPFCFFSAYMIGKEAIDNIIKLSYKYLQEAKKQGREDLVEVLTQVPRYPARNFRETLQFFKILHYSLWLEGNYHNTIGRFDNGAGLPFYEIIAQNKVSMQKMNILSTMGPKLFDIY